MPAHLEVIEADVFGLLDQLPFTNHKSEKKPIAASPSDLKAFEWSDDWGGWSIKVDQ